METRGAVTPNDFLAHSPSLDRGNDMLHPVTQAIEAFTRGEIVVVTDDDDRENEGDLILAASMCTPEKMAFIIREGCGIVCAPLTADAARRLNLQPMVAMNDAPLGTAFTVSVDTRHGLTTGISAEQRSNTVRALANGNMGASDFVRPGHVFPLIAKDGGVLMRSGHTEAAVDLCKLAALPPVAVICELANDDGTVMVGPQIEAFAHRHKLVRISVADLIAYRQAREKLVERVACFPVKTPIGELAGYAYRTPFDAVLHFAFVHGSIGDGRDMPARLHRADILGDIFGGGVIPRSAAALQGRGSRRPGLSSRRNRGRARPPRRRPAAGFGRRTRNAMARSRPGRANPARSRGVLDPAAQHEPAQICRAFGFRHRDRGGGGDRGVIPAAAREVAARTRNGEDQRGPDPSRCERGGRRRAV